MPPLLLLLLLVLPSTHTATSASDGATSACRSSFYPKLCRAMLSPPNLPPSDYGRYSVKRALKQAQRTSRLLDRYLSSGRGGANRGTEDGGALDDCRQLAGLSWGYLEAVQAELQGTVGRAGADRVRALMSAVLTNQQTCYDGLQASGSTTTASPELYGAFSNETTGLYGLSLELVSSALAGKAGNRPGSPEPASEFLGSEIGRRLAEGDNITAFTMGQFVTVAQNGTGNFTTITNAVAFAPNGTSADEGYFSIFVGPGVYQENIVVPKNKKNLILQGSGIDQTVITGNRSAIDGWTTYNSATFAVHGERFIAIDITFENTAGPEKHQAVAVRNSADLSSFYRCKFVGYQDTLYVHSLRQFYRDCEIYGTVDFICGNAASVFQACSIFARKPLPDQTNVVTAQSRIHPNQTTGISIHNCTVRAAPDLESDLGSTKTFLGRPWKEYSRTVYMQSFIDGFVEPTGWKEWNGSFALDTLYYGEFENFGPGANTSRRVQWAGYNTMDVTQAWNFTVYNFTTGDAWLPSTPIPYSGGLL